MNSPKNATLREYVLMVCLVAPLVLVGCMVGIAVDVHQTRLEFTAANADWRRETFRRIDQLLWKVDTALEIGAAARLDLGNMLTKIRAQVQKSSEDSTKATKTQTQAATVAVTKAIDTTRQAIEAVAGDARPDVAPAAAEPKVTVNVPPPTVIAGKVPEAPRVEVRALPKRRRWYGWLWPGNWRP